MNMTQDYFQLFGLTPTYELDRDTVADLANKYRELQKEVHPDRYASAPARERRAAVQYAAMVNEAYNVLRSPLKRAQYLLELQGMVFDDQTTAAIDPEFLMEQVELREALTAISDQVGAADDLNSLTQQVMEKNQQLGQAFAVYYRTSDLTAAEKTVLKMQFMDKLLTEIDRVEEELFG